MAMRLETVSLVAGVLLLLGCGVSPPTNEVVAQSECRDSVRKAAGIYDSPGRKEWPPLREAEDPDQAFEWLTSHVWGNEKLSCAIFRRDGTYHWASYPGPPCGTPNFINNGKWSFEWHKTHGYIVLDSGAALAIQFRGDQLFFIQSLIARSNKLKYSDEQRSLTRRNLPELKPLALFDRLTKHGWKKSNDFNLNMYPDKIRFSRDGRFHARYRNGQCAHGGFWSVMPKSRGYRRITMLVPFSDDNACDQRGPHIAGIAPSNSTPLMRDGMLVFFGNSYYPKHDATDVKTFTFDRYSNSVRVTGRFTGDFKVNEAKEIELSFQNMVPGFSKKDLIKVRVTQFDETGKKTVLLESGLGFTLQKQDSCQTKKIVVTPTASGENISLFFEVEYKDVRQAYHGYMSYTVRIKP